MKKEHLKLTKRNREALKSHIKKGQLNAREFKRATALLELDRGKTFNEVAKVVGVVGRTIRFWRDAYNSEGLEMLTDKPRSGRPPVIEGIDQAKITALACSEAPEGYSRWSLRLLADRAVELGYCDTISHTQVGKILKKTNSNRTRKKAGV